MASELPYKSIINDELINKALSALLQQNVDQQKGIDKSGKESIFADAAPVYSKGHLVLNIHCFKIPTPLPKKQNRPLHPKINRFELPHGLSDGSSGVLLVTRDYPKKGNSTHSNEHHLKLVTAARCNHLISEIMSVSQLAAEYSEVEARNELNSRINFVLCDKPVTNIVPRLLGRIFLISKKFPQAIKLGSTNLKKEIERKLSYTSHKMTFRNTESALPFGLPRQSLKDLAANLNASLAYLCGPKFPGGWANVKSLYLTLGLKARVPLYVSTASASSVPEIIFHKPASEVIEGDFGFGNVKITSSGDILEYTPHEDDEEPVMVLNKKKRKRKLKEAEETHNEDLATETQQKEKKIKLSNTSAKELKPKKHSMAKKEKTGIPFVKKKK